MNDPEQKPIEEHVPMESDKPIETPRPFFSWSSYLCLFIALLIRGAVDAALRPHWGFWPAFGISIPVCSGILMMLLWSLRIITRNLKRRSSS